MRKAVEDLKEKPKEERAAVAGSIAVMVVVFLLIGWGFLFLKKITRGAPVETPWGPQNDVVDFGNLQEAADSFSGAYFDATDELKRIRDEAAALQRDQIEAEGNEAFSNTYFQINNEKNAGFGDY
jgi:hypothetical protein